jgi:hypothetical protein
MRLSAAITGNLPKFMRDQVESAETAVTEGVRKVSNEIRDDLRTQVVSAGLGVPMSRTWKVAFYPKGRKSIKAAGLIYPDMPKVIRAFTSGEPIRTKHGSFLAVPTPAAPKRGVGGKRISPSTFPEHSLGKLVFVYRPRGVSLLVVENLKAGKTGKFRKAPDSAQRSGRGLTTVVMFFLVPQVRLRKRFDLAAVADKHTSDLPQAILDAWPEQKDGK